MSENPARERLPGPPAEEAREIPPRLRQGLVLSRQEAEGEKKYVIKDPTSGRFFRIGEAEFFIANLLDGRTSTEEVRRRVESHFETELDRESLDAFVRKLAGLGLLGEDELVGERPPPPRLQGGPFYLRLRTIDPDRWLGALVERARWLFSPGFVLACSLLVLLGGSIFATSLADIEQDTLSLTTADIALAWIVLFAVTFVHEIGHGATCKYFGGSVREMGFMLLYFQPAMYCNVSDAWLFPERWKRLWVTFAGAFTEMTLWAVATLVWRVAEPYTAIHTAALVVMLTSGMKTLFNLNPLIKLDGYYLLSDATATPNLRARAFAEVRRLLGWTHRGDPEPRTLRERWGLLVYAVLATLFSAWLLAFVARWIGGWLIDRYQAWGFAVFVALLLVVFRAPLLALVRSVRAGLTNSSGRWRWGRRLLGVLAVVTLAFFVRLELRVVGEVIIAPEQHADLRAGIDGIIDQVLFDEGDLVEAGDLVALLSEADLRPELEQVRAQMAEQEAQLRMLVAGPRLGRIEVARSAAAKASERLRFARIELERLTKLNAAALTSLKDLEYAREAVAVRGKELEEARGELQILLEGTRIEEIEALQAELARLQARGRHLESQISRLEIASPIDGLVTTPKLKERVGEFVERGDLIAEVHSFAAVTAEIAVPEPDIAEVEVGQRVLVKVRAYPDRTFEGSVVRISPTVTADESRIGYRTVTVETFIENPDSLLKSDMTGTAKIECGSRSLGDLLTRRIARSVRLEFWSWW
jgi:multidrug resistance efflux pump